MRFLGRRSRTVLAALLAVAMQAAFFMALAHVHPHPTASVGLRNVDGSVTLACRALVRPADCPPTIPHEHHEDCPLCWSLAASGAGVLPTPLTVVAPILPMPVLRPTASSPILAEAGASQFQARAPPAARIAA